jgi:outer membrane immunogenic protein
MSVRKYLPSALALAWMAVTPALADDVFAAPPPDGWYNNLFSAPRPPAPAPTKYADWRGFYAGGQISYSDGGADFSGSTQAPIAYSLRETDLEQSFAPSSWPVLGNADHSSAGGGGFVGYNFEYLTPNLNMVLGLEANFDIASLSMTAPQSPINLQTPIDAANNSYQVSITGNGGVSNLDWGTLRGRAGWGIGNFLPYVFFGGALGNANVGSTETLSGTQYHYILNALGQLVLQSVTPIPNTTGTNGKNQEWLTGLTTGAGLDIAVSRNFFVRAEYEYVQFQPAAGTKIDINTARLGAGVRF